MNPIDSLAMILSFIEKGIPTAVFIFLVWIISETLKLTIICGTILFIIRMITRNYFSEPTNKKMDSFAQEVRDILKDDRHK